MLELFFWFCVLILLVCVASLLALRHKFVDSVLKSEKEFADMAESGIFAQHGFSKDLTTGDTRGQKRPPGL